MKKIIIVDDENLLTEENVSGYAEIWTMFDTEFTEVCGIPIINVREITTNLINNGEKFKEIISEIGRRNQFEYKVLTENKEQYKVENYICSFAK